jgi:hypothetical protein
MVLLAFDICYSSILDDRLQVSLGGPGCFSHTAAEGESGTPMTLPGVLPVEPLQLELQVSRPPVLHCFPVQVHLPGVHHASVGPHHSGR